MSHPQYSSHPLYDDPRRFPYEASARQIPEITSYTPHQGLPGSRIYIYLQSLYDVVEIPTLQLVLQFASRRCESVLEQLESRGGYYQYALSAEVPTPNTLGWRLPQIQVQMVMDGIPGQRAQAVEVGAFTYTDQRQSSSQDISRKRKASDEAEEPMQAPAKRASQQSLPPRGPGEYGSAGYGQPVAGSYLSYLPAPSAESPYSFVSGHGRTRSQPSSLPRGRAPTQYHYGSASVNPSQSSIKAPSPQTPSYSPSFLSVNKPRRSPASIPPSARIHAGSSPSMSSNPMLVRTTALQQSPGAPPAASRTTPGGQTFNPYAMYPHKAVLKLNGDLDSMTDNWTSEEWDAKRRLVEFNRGQTGSTIHGEFKPTTLEARLPNSICISCIWWEEKQECYVTSVDTIYLLESLVAVRFTVEEKNRIRRNLEGFRPLTVSKAKADSEEFFKVIMGFPNPKPRNIEKDVKVFPWKILSHALKKIIGKYVSEYISDPTSYTDKMYSPQATPRRLALSSRPLHRPIPAAASPKRTMSITAPRPPPQCPIPPQRQPTTPPSHPPPYHHTYNP